MPSAAAASAAALLLLPLLAAAGEVAVCPRPPAAAAVLRQRHAPASCSAADAPGPRRRHAAVVEVSLAFPSDSTITLPEIGFAFPLLALLGCRLERGNFNAALLLSTFVTSAFEGANRVLALDLGCAQDEFETCCRFTSCPVGDYVW
jgi:hypothetical protein